jgi:hypothetical protein
MLERLVGESGDGKMGSATPWLLDASGADRLRAWHVRMCTLYPIRFKGKTRECKVWTRTDGTM